MNVREATLVLLAKRAPEATICPSEVARVLASAADTRSPEPDWRAAMPLVHTAVDELLADGAIQLSWKGVPLETRTGPYRISRAQRRS